MISRIERLLIALMFALLAAGITLVIASAKDGKTETSAQFTTDCAACHAEAKVTWEEGAHGQAKVMTCETCHGSASVDHPKTPMTIDRSPDLCVRCHSDSRFGVEDWRASKHNQLGMDCATCHDPHSATLRKAEGPINAQVAGDDISQLCINCHKEHSMTFSYTSHNQKGVTCVDCHVKHFGDPTGYTVPDHSFNASLASCNTCHGEQMHKAAEATEGTSAPLTAEVEVPTVSVTPEPESVSPMGFSAMAGMIGLAGGMVLAPWLERWFHRAVKHNKEEDNE
ncbi:MAG TPA: cytochrome c3 family protein [Anaerolineales bacterium]